MLEIKPIETLTARVVVPGSKSYTHRLLIASALSDGPCRVLGALESEDTDLTRAGLMQMGVPITKEGEGLRINGTGGRLIGAGEIYLANSGTGMRLLTAVATLADGPTVLTGSTRMQQRPVADLIDGLGQMGADIRSLNGTGCPPVAVTGGTATGGEITLRCGISSQYLSAILLVGPLTPRGVTIHIVEGPVSRPYIDLTLDVMERLGVRVDREGYDRFTVPGGQVYRAGDYRVETDASNASYFWAAAAVTGGCVTVDGLTESSRQGDLRLLDCFEKMGCQVDRGVNGITVTGGHLSAIDVDMGDMPDMVPTLAVVAACAEGTTAIRNVAHLKAKECDRLAAVAEELGKIGIAARCTPDALFVTGGPLHGGDIETYNDHRMAMCFSVAGLRVPGVRIMDENCVAKSFPTYWDVFSTLYAR